MEKYRIACRLPDTVLLTFLVCGLCLIHNNSAAVRVAMLRRVQNWPYRTVRSFVLFHALAEHNTSQISCFCETTP
eukprot:scaffold25307_cov168-Amphora_coffeaeformis.AAC.8